MRRKKNLIVVLCVMSALLLTGCKINIVSNLPSLVEQYDYFDNNVDIKDILQIEEPTNYGNKVFAENIPEYSGKPYIEINDNRPSFTNEFLTTESFESYSALDTLGRCGPAFANLSLETMPTEERGKIGQIKPSGWHTIRYDFIDGKYLYNRCHLIAFVLAGENANEKNLITGTRYLNVEGMLPFEIEVANYIRDTGNHVLYRVTPIYDGMNLVCNGVTMEAYSIEDNGEGVCFSVYCYNVQPGVYIDYATGDSFEYP